MVIFPVIIFKPWTTLSPAPPPKFQRCFLLPRAETGGQKKSNPTAGHVTHSPFNFDMWGRGVSVQSFPQGLKILSIYGTNILIGLQGFVLCSQKSNPQPKPPIQLASPTTNMDHQDYLLFLRGPRFPSNLHIPLLLRNSPK